MWPTENCVQDLEFSSFSLGKEANREGTEGKEWLLLAMESAKATVLRGKREGIAEIQFMLNQPL